MILHDLLTDAEERAVVGIANVLRITRPRVESSQVRRRSPAFVHVGDEAERQRVERVVDPSPTWPRFRAPRGRAAAGAAPRHRRGRGTAKRDFRQACAEAVDGEVKRLALDVYLHDLRRRRSLGGREHVAGERNGSGRGWRAGRPAGAGGACGCSRRRRALHVVPGATDAPALSGAVDGRGGRRLRGARRRKENVPKQQHAHREHDREEGATFLSARVGQTESLSTFRSRDGVDPARVPGVTAQHAPRGDSDTAPTVPSQASSAYCEHEGWKRQWPPSQGDTSFR